ncbi:MAG TPA: hypothetical protein HPQ00_16265 [Magnetococcales bacterium]|nr:hypothetical protein [Magnetococcales bacterium]
MAKQFGLPGLVVVPNAFGPGIDFDPRTMTVQNFVNGTTPMNAACPAGATGAVCLNAFAQTTNQDRTMLIDGDNWNTNTPNSAFEYMNNATFATFNTFVNANSAYRRDYPDDWALNAGLRYKDSIGGNFNYSLNYLNHYDPNPYVELSWENALGKPLSVEKEIAGGNTTIKLRDANGTYSNASTQPATLVFTEKMNRINSLGGSFDTSVETGLLGPLVLRGETLYQFNTKTPVVDRDPLSQGNLVEGLQSKDADMFKYVFGAEFIAFTNLTIGGQFIQFINVDYMDQTGNDTANSGRYTADLATMHLSNGLRKAAQYEEFASLFFSKPFGAEQQGRVNNITMNEEQGGWWNRLDGEWKLNDSWVTTAEWNQYWGNENTLFGQFHTMSNIQFGFKYIF